MRRIERRCSMDPIFGGNDPLSFLGNQTRLNRRRRPRRRWHRQGMAKRRGEIQTSPRPVATCSAARCRNSWIS